MSSASTPPTTGGTDFPRERRFVFVGFLFSLVVAEIARKAGDLYLQRRAPFGDALPAYSHLVLAALVVTTSWVGWSSSKASGGLKVHSVFSWPFLVLLIDVALVVFYFVLVREAEVPEDANKDVHPSARPESLILMEIFFFYLLWDVLTKAIIVDDTVTAPERVDKRIGKCIFRERGRISLLCLLISGGLFWTFRNVDQTTFVVLADLGLLCNVLLFRGLKEKADPRWIAIMGVLMGVCWVVVLCGK